MKKRKKLGKPEKKIQTVRQLAEPDNKLVGGKSLGRPDDGLTVSKEIKQGLLHIIKGSRALAIMKVFADFRLPSIYRIYYEAEGVISVSPEGDMTILNNKRFPEIIRLIERNFKWVIEQGVKIMPKDMASFGSLKDDQTLTGIVRKVTIQAKSKKIKEVIEGRRETEVLEFQQSEEVTKYETSGTDS